MNLGDVVVLKSGGPKMTVIEVYNSGTACKTCWFLDGVLKSGDFISKSIKLVDEDKV